VAPKRFSAVRAGIDCLVLFDFAISPHSFKPSGCFCLLLCVWVRLTAALPAVALGAYLCWLFVV
jgi:hypothetical protein